VSAISRFGRKITGYGPLWAKALRWVLFLGVFGTVAGALAFFVLYRMIGIPDANADFQTETTSVYYSDGEHKVGTFATQDRDSISGDEMPESAKAAVVAAEDRTFYTNRGLDFKGIVRAATNNATSDTTQGASTITQQYVKVLYLTQDRTLKRKAKEAVLSIKIHNQLSKPEILEGYLNTIYFGNGAYGLEVASQTYFRKPAKELSVPESAALATIINNPYAFDPYSENGKENMLGRYNYVLDGMVTMGTLDADEAEKYLDKLPEFEKKRDVNRYGGTKGYLMSSVERQLKSLEFSDSQINGGGLKIITTFSYKKQKNAVAAVKETAPGGLKNLRIGMVAIEPGTSAVRAMYGGKDYLKSQLNWATLGSQPGSTFKPFAVAAALKDGFSLKTSLNGNSPYVFENGDKVANQGDSGGQSYGRIPFSKAIASSVNAAFMDITVQMTNGPEKIREAASDAGIPDSVMKKIEPVNVVSLGYAPVPTIDMANAYATYANEGKSAKWYMIEKVEDAQERELYKHEVIEKRTVSEDVAADVTSALQGVVRNGSGTNGRTQCPTAGKTGTATAGEGDSQHVSSSWFIGYTPKVVTAVMYARGKGNENLEGYLPTFFGGQYPAKTFRNFMVPSLTGTECGTFPPAANLDGDKGTIYKPPAPTCSSDEKLNDSKTRCVKKPEPTPTPTPTPTQEPCAADEQPDGNLGCEEKKPKPDPTTCTPTATPCPPPPT